MKSKPTAPSDLASSFGDATVRINQRRRRLPRRCGFCEAPPQLSVLGSRIISFVRTALACWLAARVVSLPLTAQTPPALPPAALREALSVLRDHCLACHGDGKKKGGLSLASREEILKGGDEGPAAVTGQPDSSRLVQLLSPTADPHMPPKKQLEPRQIEALRAWVAGGLPWDASVFDPDAVPLTPVTLAALPASYHPAFAVALSSDSKRLVRSRGAQLILQDLSATNRPVLKVAAIHPDPIQSLSFSPDGTLLASGSFRQVTLWSADGLQVRQTITHGLLDRITALAFSPDGKFVAVADGLPGRSGVIRLVEAATARILVSWKAHQDTIYSFDFNWDGKKLVTAGADRLVKIWDADTHKEIAVLEGHTGQVLGAAFNTDATQVVSGGADKQLKVWDIATRERIITLGNHAAAITAVAWPGDGSSIYATTDAGAVLRYTNLKRHTGEQSSATADEKRVGTVAEPVLSLAVSADGKEVCTGSQEGAVHVWDSEGKAIVTFESGSTDSALAAGPEVGTPAVAVRRPIPVPAPTNAAALRTTAQAANLVSLTVEPTTLELTPDAPSRTFLVTGRTADGFEIDLTEWAKYKVDRRAPFDAGEPGRVTAVRGGEEFLRIRFGGLETNLPVRVTTGRPPGAAFVSDPPSFVRDVLPALNRAGCSAGPCHAKAEGQNGFKLSVFSYDPRADYVEIVKETLGRRVFPAAPDESLILRKALGTTPHEGGQRFERGSPTHALVVDWIRRGLPLVTTNEAALEGISVSPGERRYHRGTTQRLRVEAHYRDGSTRDVTHLAAYDSNDKEVARVDEHGRLTVGTLTGQAVIVARYMGFVAASQVLVPAEHLLPASQYAALPRQNFIDEHAYAQMQRLGLLPSAPCTDAEFLRRASLDTIGRLPTADEVRSFLQACEASPEAAARERQALIERLLQRPEFGDFWANKWADLLRPNSDRVGVKSVFVLDQWLREQFRANRPYDEFVREILTAEGSNHRDGPAVIYRDRREPPELTTMFSQLFLGVRFECAKCHHHPNEKWSQDDFYQFAAFFGPVKQKGAGLSPPISAGNETFYYSPGGAVRHPVTSEVMKPRPPDGPLAPADGATDPREALVAWLTATENPFFARAAVNRVWASFFGRGLVEPVDDFRISNPCVNPALLEALARDFATHRYDLKHLIRTLLSSHLYRLSAAPNDTNVADTKHFSRSYRRRLPAEVLLDAVNDITGIPDTFAATPVGYRAMQTWSYKIESHFLDAFGRPNASSDCPCERDREMSVVQSLHLMNSRNLQSKLSHAEGRVRKLAEGPGSPAGIVEELYLTTLGRRPSEEELKAATAAFTAAGATRQSGTEDVLWALLNSPEFVLNH